MVKAYKIVYRAFLETNWTTVIVQPASNHVFIENMAYDQIYVVKFVVENNEFLSASSDAVTYRIEGKEKLRIIIIGQLLILFLLELLTE